VGDCDALRFSTDRRRAPVVAPATLHPCVGVDWAVRRGLRHVRDAAGIVQILDGVFRQKIWYNSGMDTTAIIDTLVKIIDRLTKQPGALSVRSTVALERIGDILMDGFQGVKDAIAAEAASVAQALEAVASEMQQAIDALQGNVTEAEKQEAIDQLVALKITTDDLTQKIRNIIPDAPVPDPDPNA